MLGVLDWHSVDEKFETWVVIDSLLISKIDFLFSIQLTENDIGQVSAHSFELWEELFAKIVERIVVHSQNILVFINGGVEVVLGEFSDFGHGGRGTEQQSNDAEGLVHFFFKDIIIGIRAINIPITRV